LFQKREIAHGMGMKQKYELPENSLLKVLTDIQLVSILAKLAYEGPQMICGKVILSDP
jgi:hypothetical protein